MTITPQAPEGVDRIRPIQFITVGKQANLPAPFIRVTACGLLTIEVAEEVISSDPPQASYISLSADQVRGRGTAPALTLLKLLLSRPERFALRDWLIEQFCRDRELFSSVRLDNIVSQLRSLLCPPAYEDLRTQIVAHVRGSASSGDGYQLASYPLIWTDLDALTWNVEQAARMERFGDDPLPYWERAYALARRGIFLPDELYSDWATARRGEVAGMLRQSVQALARLYLERHGKTGEEEALLVLRSYWQEHPQEEDVLRPLMELLGQRECYQEALEYYEHLKSLLEADDCQPDPRTQDVAAYLKTKQIKRQQVTMHTGASAQCSRLLSSKAPIQRTLLPFQPRLLFSQEDRQDIIDEENVSKGQIDLESQNIEQNERTGLSFRMEEQDGASAVNMDNERRKLIKGIGIGIGVTSLSLFFPDFSSLASISEQLKQYHEQVPLHWDGFFTIPEQSAIPAIEAVILHLQRLSPYANTSQQEIIQTLLCQYHQLAADQFRDRGQIDKALKHGDLAIYFAEHLRHVELLAAALYRRGLTYFDAGQIDAASRDLNDALPFARISRPQLKGMVSMEAGRFLAHLARSKRDEVEATCLLDQTEHIVGQGHLEADAGYVKLNQGRYHIGRAATLLALKHPQEALKELQVAERLTPTEYQRRHAYINILRARVLFSQHQYDQAAYLALNAFHICQIVHSESNISDISRLYSEFAQSPFAQAAVVQDLGFRIRQHQKGALL
jgi:tetratricopeptide (TPR) repeat protein